MMRFLGIEAAGGVLLIVATMVALFWANSPWSASYHDLWHTEIHMGIGDLVALEHNGHPLTLGQFVNDVLMVIFFCNRRAASLSRSPSSGSGCSRWDGRACTHLPGVCR